MTEFGEGKIVCEGCWLVHEGQADPRTPKFQKQYPLCPGHPTESSCHGYFAGCNCKDCEEKYERETFQELIEQEGN